MQPTFAEIKSAAKKALSSRWPEAIILLASLLAVCLLNTLSQMLLMNIFKVDAVWSPLLPADIPSLSVIASIGITVFSAVFSLCITAPFALGVMKWFWSITNESNAQLDEIFYFFSESKLFFKAVFFNIIIYIRIIVTAIICFLPYTISNFFLNPDFFELIGAETPIFVSALFPVVLFFRTLGVIAILFFSVRYSLFGIVLFKSPELSLKQSLRLASKITKNESARLTSFYLSFFGWLVLSLAIIPLIFTGPYLAASLSVYGREMIREHETPFS